MVLVLLGPVSGSGGKFELVGGEQKLLRGIDLEGFEVGFESEMEC